MRRLLVALCSLALISPAVAGDFDPGPLRGSNPFVPAAPVYTNWSGFYVGGQAGYNSAHFDFSKMAPFNDLFANPFTNFMLTSRISPVSRWAQFGSSDSNGANFGGFAGFNWQWDDVTVGLEANYSHLGLSGSSTAARSFPTVPSPPGPSGVPLGDGNTYNVNASATAALKIEDYTSFRARGGWSYGNFLPYVAFGLVVGRAEVTRSATAVGTPAPVPPPPGAPIPVPFSFAESIKTNQVAWGYSAAVGFDAMVWSCVFLRGEYEFVQFRSIADIETINHTVRVGVGYKF